MIGPKLLATAALVACGAPLCAAPSFQGPPQGGPPGGASSGGPPPRPEPGVKRALDGLFDGYNLVSPLGARDVVLFDMQGEAVHTWPTELAPGGPVYLLDDGSILRPGRVDENPRFKGGGIGGRIERIAWDGEPLWQFDLLSDEWTQHHDLAVLPNGNVLAVVWVAHSPEEARRAGRDPEVVREEGLWSCSVLEIAPRPPKGGDIVWRWNSWDHLIQDQDESLPNHGSIPDHPERIDVNADHRDRPPMTEAEREKLAELERKMRALGYIGGDDDEDEPDDAAKRRRERGTRPDWLHTNSVDYNAPYDLIVLSTPHLCELWVIDHSTTTAEAAGSTGGRWKKGGDLLWRWGNPRNYGRGSDAEQRLFYQHDPKWLEGPVGDLRLTVYNNGGGRPGGDYSSVEELVLPFSESTGFLRAPDKAFGPEQPAWSFGEPGVFFSPFISGAQRLPNGNTLICEGAPGRLLEVSGSGKILWEYVNGHYGRAVPKSAVAPDTPPGALFRATRVARDHPGLAGRDLAPGD